MGTNQHIGVGEARGSSPRAGLWLWLCGWLVAASFVSWHAIAVDRYLDRVSETRFTSQKSESPLQRVPQAIAPDAQVWVLHAVALAETGRWRLRSTDIDNAPEGRPIYWNSGWALWLEACGRMRRAFTGEPLPAAIENASAWANLPVFLLVMTLASGWVWRRWGGLAGGFVALGLAGHRGFYAGFYPSYADHHGLIAACVLGVVLGVALAGSGWWQREETTGIRMLPDSRDGVMRAMTLSAVCGALGLWVSAASLTLTIGFVGCSGLLAGLLSSKMSGCCEPGAWQRWGRLGALLSIGFYLLENVPDRLGLRLEANHPLYALAWLGAGEIIGAVLAWRHEQRPSKWLAARLVGWGSLVVLVPVVVWVGGAAVFVLRDPFLGRVYHSVLELQPFSVEFRSAGWGGYGDQVLFIAGLLAVTLAWFVSRSTHAGRPVVITAAGVVAGAVALGFYQNRWLLTAGAPQIVLGAALIAAWLGNARGWRVWVVTGAATALCAIGPWTLARERLHVERVRDVQLGETVQLLYRDISGALRKSGADEKSIVLTDPNASVGVGYYGRLRTLGTLYWENRDGLLAAAEILGAHHDADAAARIYARGITHVVMVSSYDFLAEYNYALRGGAGPVEDRAALGHRLLYQHRVPVWLRPLNYRVPAPLVPLGFKVAVFAVDFETPPAIANERIGRYQLSKGERGLAEASFMAAMTADATRPEPWLRMGELALAAGRIPEAFNFIRAGIERVPTGDRERLVQGAAELFRRQGPEGAKQAEALLGLLKR